MRKFQARVEKGMKFLDKAIQNWEKKIDLEELDIKDPFACIVGQLIYAKAFKKLDIFDEAAHGFSVLIVGSKPSMDETLKRLYRTLTNEWKRQIKERLAA